MKLNRITIRQLSSMAHSGVLDYKGQLIISDHIAQEYLFAEPCRLDAVTILVCIRGRLDYEVNLEHNVVTTSSILVNMPENIIQFHSSENLEAYAILVSTELLQSIPNDLQQMAKAYLPIKQHFHATIPLQQMASLVPFYQLIESALSSNGPETDNIVRCLLEAFLLSLLALMREHQPKDIENDRTASRGSRVLSERFMELLSQHHQQERMVQFYADKLCVTPKYLSMVVKDYSGKNPSDWICEYVIAEAKSLLHYSQLSVQEVAFRLNFPTQSAFGKFFKQKTGVSPTQYLKSRGQ